MITLVRIEKWILTAAKQIANDPYFIADTVHFDMLEIAAIIAAHAPKQESNVERQQLMAALKESVSEPFICGVCKFCAEFTFETEEIGRAHV